MLLPSSAAIVDGGFLSRHSNHYHIMKIIIFLVALCGLMSCSPSKTATDQIYTNIANPVDKAAKIALQMADPRTIYQGVIDHDYVPIVIHAPIYTEPCYMATAVTTNPTTPNEFKTSINCAELEGPWLASFVWVLSKNTDTGVQWTSCPVLLRYGTMPGDTIFVHATSIRLDPAAYDERIFVQN